MHIYTYAHICTYTRMHMRITFVKLNGLFPKKTWPKSSKFDQLFTHHLPDLHDIVLRYTTNNPRFIWVPWKVGNFCRVSTMNELVKRNYEKLREKVKLNIQIVHQEREYICIALQKVWLVYPKSHWQLVTNSYLSIQYTNHSRKTRKNPIKVMSDNVLWHIRSLSSAIYDLWSLPIVLEVHLLNLRVTALHQFYFSDFSGKKCKLPVKTT